MSGNIKEKAIEKYLKQQVEKNGGWCVKFTSPGTSGVPDRIIFLPGGEIHLVEVKAPGKKPTPLQLAVHRKLAGLKVPVEIVDTMEAVNDLIDKICL